MSPAVRTMPARKPVRRKKKQSGPALLSWLPLLAGVAVTPLAVRSAAVMAISGPAALRLLYPYVVLLQGRPSASDISQGLMYLQFPLYGLAASLVMRARGLASSLLIVLVLHFGAVLASFYMVNGR